MFDARPTKIIEPRDVRRWVDLFVPDEVPLNTFSRQICWQRERPDGLEGILVTNLQVRNFAMLGVCVFVNKTTSSLRCLVKGPMDT
jgi:hypothetical protein